MMRTGDCVDSKDGGPHEMICETVLATSRSKKDVFKTIKPSRIKCDTSTENTLIQSQVPGLQCDSSAHTFQDSHHEIVSKSSSSSTNSVRHSVEEEKGEGVDRQSIDWLKSTDYMRVIDILELDTKATSLSGLSMAVMDGNPDLSENLTDFVFTSAVPESVMVKHNSNNLEALKYEDHTAAASSGSLQNTAWISHSGPSSQDTIVTQLSTNPETESFETFTEDVLADSGGVNTCNSTDLNSILFETITPGSRPDTSTVEILQYPDGLNFAVDRNLINVDESALGLNSGTASSIKSVPLTFSTAVMDHEVSLTNLHESSNDLTLNSLPNFLELDNSVPSTSCHSFVDSHLVSMSHVQGISDNVADPKSERLESQLPHDIVQFTNPDTRVTEVSIANSDQNTTKILINAHQKSQQMYVINAADLNLEQSNNANINVSHESMFVINTADLTGDSSKICTSDSNIENVSISSCSQPLSTQSSFTSTAIPGFVLMPVVDSASNVIQAVPIQVSGLEYNTKLQPVGLPKKIFMCPEPGCQKTFKKASKLKVHQMMHTGERPYKCSLLGCEWAFTTSNKLKRHMESHAGRKDYICDKPGCGHRFTTIYNLNTHRKLHDRPCTEPCTEEGCNQSFPTKRQLDLHLRNVHACEDRTYKCPQPGCEKVFFSCGCMGSHMKVHQQNAEDLKCKYPGCGKEFTKMCRLRQHERLHSGERPFICDYEGCNWAFATASKLKRHQTKHTGVRRWVCEVCKKQFHRSEHLKGHLITHSGDRPFVCPVEGCGNTFTAKSSLYVHLKKHDESGKTIVYHCPMEKCERHYANKASLRQHILVKHCNVPQKGAATTNQGIASWLSVLGNTDSSGDASASQESYTGAGIVDQALLNSSSEGMTDESQKQQISHLVVSAGGNLPVSANFTGTITAVPLHVNSQQHTLQGSQQVQQHLFTDDQIDQRLLEAGELLQQQQQQQRMSFEAVERGKKSQIMLENMNGSARTDSRSNDIISQRALKRWQKQKEIEAAKLRAQLDGQTTTPTTIYTTGDYKSPFTNQQLVHTILVSRSANQDGAATGKEIPDMELEAEGISDSVLAGSPVTDSFMTDLFIRDPETGITYRQTQLLQDDPPNPEMLGDMENAAPSNSVVLDSSLDAHFVEDSLNFHHLE